MNRAWRTSFKRRTARTPSGIVVRFSRGPDGRWHGLLDRLPEDRSILERAHEAELVAEAETAWEGERAAAACLIVEAGEALHGEKWRQYLANDLGVARNTVRWWADGTIPLGLNHPVFDRLADVLRARGMSLIRLAEEIEGRMAKARAGIAAE
jgi:hypothetical protein